jgi:ribosomal protein S12 methylthiotransferase
VLVTGCLGAQPERIRARHPNLLGITGPHAYQQVLAAIDAQLPRPHEPCSDLVPPQGLRLTPSHYAYLKISEGCNNRCSFCIIPSMRGRLQSRPLDDVMREAEALVRSGVQELLVISQDTSAYGADLRYRSAYWQERRYQTRFIDLARALSTLGVWVRLHYVYPYPHVDEVVELMQEPGVLPYLDVPFQHASPAVLRRMRRPAGSEDTLHRIQAWRRARPDLALRSSFIVGFPGESEQEFEELLAWLDEAQIDRVGCFKYSAVDGAAANALAAPVSEEIKHERYERFMQKAAAISRARLQARIGRRCRVLVDAVQNGVALARSSAEAPEIDGILRVQGASQLRAGMACEVEIIAADTYDLRARVVGAHDARVSCGGAGAGVHSETAPL